MPRSGLAALAPGLALATLIAFFSGVQAVLAPLLLARSGWAPVGLTASYLVVSASSMLATPMFGALLARHGRRRPLAVALFVAANGAALFPWLTERWVLSAVLVVLNLATILIWIAAVAVVADVAGRRGIDHSMSFGLVNVVWAAGNMAGSVTSAALAPATGDAGPYGLVAAWLGVVLLVVLASRQTDKAHVCRPRALRVGGGTGG